MIVSHDDTPMIFAPSGVKKMPRPARTRYPRQWMESDIRMMTTANQVIPSGVALSVPWRTTPQISCGMIPSTSQLEPWWTGNDYSNMKACVPWWFSSKGQFGHQSVNTGIELSGMQLNVLRKTGQWDVLYSQKQTIWSMSTAEDAVGLGNPTTWTAVGADGGTEFQPGTYYNGDAQSIHGGGGRVQLWPDAATEVDYDAIHCVARFRAVLVNKSGIDDRHLSNLGMQIGTDYYPSTTFPASGFNSSYVPAIGVGNFTRVRPDGAWTYACFFVSNPGVDVLGNLPPAFGF